MTRWLLLGFAWLALPSLCQAAPSFDCRKASTPVEHLICSSGELSSLDGQLGRAVSAWLKTAGPDHACRLRAQRNWLKQRLSRCNIPAAESLSNAGVRHATACLKRVYQERLAVLAAAPDAHAKANAPGDERRACSGLADAIRTADPSATQSILTQLTKAETGFVRMDVSNRVIGSGDEAEDALRELLHWPNDAKVPDFSNWFVGIKRLGGGSSVIAAEMVAGTADCQSFWFYELFGTNPATAISPPEDDGTGYCWGSDQGDYATLGAIGGVPTFAVEDFDQGNESLRLIARHGEEWHPYCRLRVAWNHAFTVSEAFCDGAGCDDLRAQAPDLVRTYDATGNADKYWAAVPSLLVPEGHKARFAAYVREKAEASPTRGGADWVKKTVDSALASATYRTIDIGGQQRTFVRVVDHALADWTGIWAGADGKTLQAVDLSPIDPKAPTGVMAMVPTFGDQAMTSYVSFQDSAIVPIRLGGRLRLARIGHGYLGWRQSDDYLIGVFGFDGSDLKPVAGAVVGKGRTNSPTVTVQ